MRILIYCIYVCLLTLKKFNSDPKQHDDNAHLVVSQKLLAEYYRTMGNAASTVGKKPSDIPCRTGSTQ